MDKCVKHIQNSARPRREMLDKLSIEWYNYLPNYFAMECDEYGFPMKEIYPSRNEIQNIREQFIKDNKIQLLKLKKQNNCLFLREI